LHTGTTSLRKCTITTTITNVRHGSYVSSADGLSHRACVVFFSFEIGAQNRGADQRVKELEIKLSVFRSPNSPAGSGAVEVRLRVPVRGKGVKSTRNVVRAVNVGVDAGYTPFVSANGGVSHSTTQDLADWQALDSSLKSSKILTYRLKENETLKDGVPEVLECALVIKTDGSLFSIAVDFDAQCPFMGGLLSKRARTNVLVDEGDVAGGRMDRGDEAITGLGDMDGELFMKWVESQIKNEWMER
jgi:hypothetical protein